MGREPHHPGKIPEPGCADLSGANLETPGALWDSPHMRLLSDDRCRLQSRDLFKPNTPYEAEKSSDGSVRLVELLPREVPLVKPRRTREGFLMLPVKLDPKAVRAAVRADRDER